ncbi:hypothetical protein Celaphus_00012954 [Cervus elaphus hippelaphus]|uniref:Uncharacterized protein n=1 Tax=Cervus elaphus hippelaphus TaxID=46360 RepID=A0A212CI21_CEREH|nr:hypothetical protein Celaphus_00012954 [Cervus elaphus hippelaphus]
MSGSLQEGPSAQESRQDPRDALGHVLRQCPSWCHCKAHGKLLLTIKLCRQDNDGISGDGDDMEIFIEELGEIRRKQGAAIEENTAPAPAVRTQERPQLGSGLAWRGKDPAVLMGAQRGTVSSEVWEDSNSKRQTAHQQGYFSAEALAVTKHPSAHDTATLTMYHLHHHSKKALEP